MPGIEDWTTRPLSTIEKLFEETQSQGGTHEAFLRHVYDYFTQRLDDSTVSKIPSLNSIPLDELSSGTLVKYRCMIQDVFDPQYTLGQYKIKNSNTGEERLDFGSFRDYPHLDPHESVESESKENVIAERFGFYCVPIPGESTWAKEAYARKNVERKMPSTSASDGRSKRGRDCEDEAEKDLKSSRNLPSIDHVVAGTDSKTSADNTVEMISEPEASSARAKVPPSAEVIDMNFPLPNETGLPCIARVYLSDMELKTTDAVELVGILSLDPNLAQLTEENEDVEDNELINKEEMQAHEPPASLIPRVHVLVAHHISHNNPLVPGMPSQTNYKTFVNELMHDASSLRLELLSVLQHALLCDALAAEYTLCCLLSSVYGRADILPLGKFTVNIAGCPTTQKYTQFLHHLISQLTSQTVFFEMSKENLNSMKLIPKKNYKSNRLTAGLLQLMDGTHLVIDETALSEGQLGKEGVMNITALADLISWQRVNYDFEWHPVQIQTDVRVLVLSEEISLLPKDVYIRLAANQEIVDLPGHFTKLDNRLTPENLDKLRAYITVCRLMDYSVSADLETMMQNDFVQARQANAKDMSVEDFQTLLILVRLLTMSYGRSTPTEEIWRKAKGMEEARKNRLASRVQ